MSKLFLFYKLSRLLFGLALLALVFLPGGGLVFAQEGTEAVQLTAQVGFDGYCKQDAWLPVRVAVANTGTDLEATVRVSYKNSGDGLTSTSTEVSLPTGSRKEFFLYIYPQGILREFQVSVLEGNKILQSTRLPVSCLSAENMVFGVLSDTPSAFDVLSDVKPLTGFVRVAQLSLSDLPDRVQAWGALDALVVSNVDTAALSPEQKQALQVWLGAGGRLFVTGGLKWQGTTAGLLELLPLEVTSTRNVASLSALQAYSQSQSLSEAGTAISVGTLRAGAQVLIEQNGVPLLIQRPAGFGSVYFLAADPAVRPLSNWRGMQDLYALTLAARPPIPRWQSVSFSSSYTIDQALGALEELGLPSILYICGLLGFYVAVIGPLNFLVLRAVKRRELAWVTVPALVIMFSCLSYGAGFLYRGRTPILNRLVLVQAWDGLPQAEARALVGVYSPVRARYEISAGGGFLPSRFNSSTGNLQSNDDWIALQQDDAMRLPDVRVEIGGLKAVALDGSLPALPISHDLTLSLSRTYPLLTGEIRNDSAYTLQNAILITPTGWRRLGALAPGAAVNVNISLATLSNGPEFYQQNAMTILDVDYLDLQNNVLDARQHAFLQSTLATYDYRAKDGNWGIFLMGWLDGYDLPIGLQDRKFEAVDTLIYVHSLTPELRYDADSLNLPPAMFAWESSMLSATPYYVWDIPTSGYVMRFVPALPVQFSSVESLRLYLFSNTSSSLTTSAWDYEANNWVVVGRSSGTVTISDPARFVAPNGEVRIRVVNNQTGYVEITASYITLVVKP